ncbi:hypothetical protein PA598K_02116 [Paenibacillus sp. 598K]|uniref:copper amine oxidase N-terminal domain-containing protein n=1 Tax=Paenibacillus sp. 598K TaxID=1117987 RepID=UPI000FF9DF30|nr:copper amine oxidase N-terminal domain-containing protein [Paenibacillus sp. 598K]GBF73795.1 hypothetical protein PA598K_02116 [Paenibacillus sp. 598K]
MEIVKLRLLFPSFVLLALLFSVGHAAAFTHVKVILNGETMEFSPSAGETNGTTLVPLRQLFESLDATVDFNEATKMITVTSNDVKMTLTINSLEATINDRTVTLFQAPAMNEDVMYVNLRFLTEGLGYTVHWDQPSLTVRINS